MIDEQGLYDIYGLSHLPFWQTTLFMGIVSAIGLVCLAIIGYRCIQKYLRTTHTLTYWEQALAELAQLRSTLLFALDKKSFYASLTKVIKRYLSNHYNATYEGKTDQELFEILSNRTLLLSCSNEDLVSLFHVVTPVKFARTYEQKLEMEKDLDRVVLFIQAHVRDYESSR